MIELQNHDRQDKNHMLLDLRSRGDKNHQMIWDSKTTPNTKSLWLTIQPKALWFNEFHTRYWIPYKSHENRNTKQDLQVGQWCGWVISLLLPKVKKKLIFACIPVSHSQPLYELDIPECYEVEKHLSR